MSATVIVLADYRAARVSVEMTCDPLVAVRSWWDFWTGNGGARDIVQLADERNKALLKAWDSVPEDQRATRLPEFISIAMIAEAEALAHLRQTRK